MALSMLATRIFNTPLMIDAGKAAVVLDAIGERMTPAGFLIDDVAQMGVVGDRLGRAYDSVGVKTFDEVDGIAIIGVEGTLVHKGAYVGAQSGITSYQGLQAQITRAHRNPAIRGVVLEVDSFGGEVPGAFATAKMIAALSAAKPTMAILTDHALSAGYLMASQARQIVMPEDGRAGSIGALRIHMDKQGKAEKEGVKVRFFHAGARKVEGNPFEDLPEDYAARLQADVEAARDRFAAAVAEARGARFPLAAVLATESAHFNAAESLDLGIVDAVGDPHEAFRAFASAVNRA